jgi:spore germination protein D
MPTSQTHKTPHHEPFYLYAMCQEDGLRMKSVSYISRFFLITILFNGCATPSSSQQELGYNQAKTMVLDILKSDEGKKAITEAAEQDDKNAKYEFKMSKNESSSSSNDRSQSGSKNSSSDSSSDSSTGKSKIKLLSNDDFTYLQTAVQHVLANNQTAFLKNLITDTRFASDFAKAIQSDTSELHKHLLKDPEYQKLLLDVMKNPEYEKILMDNMKTIPYRQFVMKTIEESFQSPLFKSNLVDLFKLAIQNQSEPESSSQDKEKNKSDQQGGQDSSKSKDQGSNK